MELTHRLLLAKDANDENAFKNIEKEETDQRNKQVQDIETNIAISRAVGEQTLVEATRPAEGGVKGDVTGANKERKGRAANQKKG